MDNSIISVENISKIYRLGVIGTGTFSNDLKVWWARVRGKPNPLAKIGKKDYGNQVGDIIWALKDVSFKVEPGEVLGIVGRNGSGKSTLLKILSRVTAPSEGYVKIKGRIASLLEVGTGFHPELTGKENVYLNGAILGMSTQEITRKFDEIVDFAEIEPFIDTPVKRYSSGMYVRLAFAVAAHLESDILLVDEVLAVGDAEFQKKCLGKMNGLASEEGRTVLFVSHNMVSVRRLCERGILLNAGRIEKTGPIDSVLKTYMQVQEDIQSTVLKNRTDRKGSGQLLFTDIDIRDDFNIPFSVKLGSHTRMYLKYEGERDMKNVHISVTLNNQYGERVSWLSNEVSGNQFRELPKNGTIRIDFPNLPYAAGTYSVELTARVGKVLADKISHAAQLIVHPGDFYKSGKKVPTKAGAVLVPHTWSVESEN